MQSASQQINCTSSQLFETWRELVMCWLNLVIVCVGWKVFVVISPVCLVQCFAIKQNMKQIKIWFAVTFVAWTFLLSHPNMLQWHIKDNGQHIGTGGHINAFVDTDLNTRSRYCSVWVPTSPVQSHVTWCQSLIDNVMLAGQLLIQLTNQLFEFNGQHETTWEPCNNCPLSS